jgi:hypothetical protein
MSELVRVTPDEVRKKSDLQNIVSGQPDGTTFVFAPGVYELADRPAPVHIPASARFTSEEPGQAVLRGDPEMTVGDKSAGLQINPGAEGFTLEGFVIESFDNAVAIKGSGAPTGRITVRGNTFSNYGERAVILDTVEGGTIAGNTIVTEQPQKGGSDAVVVTNSELVLVHGNELRGAPIPIQVFPANRSLVANNRILRNPQTGAPGAGSIGMLFGGNLKPFGSRNCHAAETSHFAAIVGNEVVAAVDPSFQPGHIGLALVGPDEVAGMLVVGNRCDDFVGSYDLALLANRYLLADNRSSGASIADYVFGNGMETPGNLDHTHCGPGHDNVVVAADDASVIGPVGENGNVLVRDSELNSREPEYRSLIENIHAEVERAIANPEELASVLDELQRSYEELRTLLTTGA